jgi:hypothetical protein
MVNIYTSDRKVTWWAWDLEHAIDVLQLLQRANPRMAFIVVDQETGDRYIIRGQRKPRRK